MSDNIPRVVKNASANCDNSQKYVVRATASLMKLQQVRPHLGTMGSSSQVPGWRQTGTACCVSSPSHCRYLFTQTVLSEPQSSECSLCDSCCCCKAGAGERIEECFDVRELRRVQSQRSWTSIFWIYNLRNHPFYWNMSLFPDCSPRIGLRQEAQARASVSSTFLRLRRSLPVQ